MTHPTADDILEIEARARVLRAAHARAMVTALVARLRRIRAGSDAAHA